jgi:hypothetical protein
LWHGFARFTIARMYKLIKGTVDELESRLNAAVAEGYTQLFREFPPPVTLVNYDSSQPAAPDVYAFMMKRPDSGLPSAGAMAQYASAFREVVVAMGFGDRLPPVPKDAPVVDLVRKAPPPTDGASKLVELVRSAEEPAPAPALPEPTSGGLLAGSSPPDEPHGGMFG